jgi:hypothetical protein
MAAMRRTCVTGCAAPGWPTSCRRCPHLDVFPTNTIAEAARWAADIGGPAYAIDDQTAIKVANGTVEVVSEGRWKEFP